LTTGFITGSETQVEITERKGKREKGEKLREFLTQGEGCRYCTRAITK